MTRSLNLIRKFYFGFAVLIVLLVLVLAIAFLSFRQMAEANRWNVHTYRVLVETHGISEGLVNMEMGARAFAVTGDRSLLPLFTEGSAGFSRHFNAAQTLIKDSVSARLQRKLGGQQRQWVKVYIEPMLALRQSPPNSAPLNPADTLETIKRISIAGKPHTDGMRRTLADINNREQVLLRQRSQRAESLQTWTAATLLAGGLFAVILASLLSLLLMRNTRRLTDANTQLGTEINERTEAERLLRETSEHLKMVSEVSQLGDWDLDLASGKAHRSLRHDQIFGYQELRPEWSYETFLQHVHPDDRTLADAPFQRAVANGGDWDFECRIIWPDQSLHWIWGRGRVFQQNNEKPTRMLGTVADITESKRGQEEMRALSLRLMEASYINQRIMDYSLDIICTIDEAGRFKQVSPACQKVWGYAPEELAGREYIALVHPDDVALTNQAALSVLSGQPVSSFENRYLSKDGVAVPMMWSAVWSETDKMMFCVARDDTEHKQAEKAIREAIKEAERASAAKSEFLSRTSHELRTPLNAILGFAQLLEMDELNPEQAQGIKQILKGGRHLLELVNEVLDIASIDAGRMALSSEPVQLRDLAQETITLLAPLADERRIRFQNNLGKGFVLADLQRLKQVLLNLISNAVKYNRDGGQVRLESGTAAVPGRVRFEVTDTGPGISPAGLEKVFAPFERLDAGEMEIEGTGIGLTISERLVHLMDGEIGVYSIEGAGTTFWVELPDAQDPIDAVERRKTARPQLELAAPQNGSARTVLYIEDNLSNLNLVEHILARRANIKLLSAMQGRRGLELAREHGPDLILLDLHLPDINGDEVLQLLRAETETRDIPVVMLSADATPRQIERLKAAGATAYLTKPLDIKQFMATLDENLRD